MPKCVKGKTFRVQEPNQPELGPKRRQREKWRDRESYRNGDRSANQL